MSKNWSYTIREEGHPHNGKTLWSGRYCAVCGVVLFYNEDTGETFALANKRGNGTPDYQGFWNLPCGFLEANESGQQGVAREVYEETGLAVDSDLFELFGVETEPEKSNNGNVSIRYIAYLYGTELPKLKYKNINGEEGEVEDVKWINIANQEYAEYEWAFNHQEILEDLYNTTYA